LERLDNIIHERTKIAERYLEAFKDIQGIRLPQVPDACTTNWQSFSIYLMTDCKVERNDLMQRLLDVGVASRRGVMTSHRESAYKNSGVDYHLPISEDAADRSIIIPLYVPMADEEIDYVIAQFKACLNA